MQKTKTHQSNLGQGIAKVSTRPSVSTRTQSAATKTPQDNQDQLPLFLTPDEAADLLRTSRKAIYVKIERRQLPGVSRVGRRLLIRSRSLLDWLDQQGASSLLMEDQR